MSMSDPLADMCTRIRNAASARHETVRVPASNVKAAVAEAHRNKVKVLLCVGGAGTGKGFVSATEDAAIRATATAVAGQLRDVGIRATVKIYEWGLFGKRMFSHQASPIALMTWAEVKGDPHSHNRLQLLKLSVI